ncbi:STAS domain-containing protein [Streptomyces sp. ERV7]|uniref:STAS domain-containing protein n=1 Tax=Streptomyces sp. ERV7 TaxID=1322334 RepID=UPI001F1EB7C8|nr:STAS domain-containing protein [Streptomyces sp. ERV7]
MNPTEPALLVVPSPTALSDVPPLCERLRALYAAGAREVVCDVGALVRADLAAVEAVARLCLTARRAGGRLTIRNAGPGLVALLELTGLTAEPGGPLSG